MMLLRCETVLLKIAVGVDQAISRAERKEQFWASEHRIFEALTNRHGRIIDSQRSLELVDPKVDPAIG